VENYEKLTQEMIDRLIHEVNVAHSIHLNDQARFHIQKICNTYKNKQAIRWNELGHWLNRNPDATVDQIKVIREMLDNNEYIRNYKFCHMCESTSEDYIAECESCGKDFCVDCCVEMTIHNLVDFPLCKDCGKRDY